MCCGKGTTEKSAPSALKRDAPVRPATRLSSATQSRITGIKRSPKRA